MGQSPSADLFYGYDLGTMETGSPDWEDLRPEWLRSEDEDGGEIDSEEADEHLARKLGWIEEPFPDLPEIPYDLPYEEKKRLRQEQWETPEWKAWSSNRDEKQRLNDSYGVTLDTYGYGEGETHWFVRIDASHQRAYDWGSTLIDPIKLIAVDDWDQKLAAFMELMELPTLGKAPGWHMNCSYG